jgi:catechol 2,3-dioxygenase-like lactoylglutathione lyase family enzyme
MVSDPVPKVERIVPILNVRDVAASLKFYVDVLGFDRSWHWGHPPTFGGVHAGEAEIQFCLDGQGGPGTWLAIWVDDVDAWYERLRAKQVDIRQPPTNFPWGVRELNVADLDGHRIRFSTATHAPADSADFPD